jgi:hypothetical protein
MKSLGVLDWLDDGLNPIVVKELRQAVQSKFVVAVLLLFLLIQIVVIGIYLVVAGLDGTLHTLEAESGRTVFSILQGILLFTCLLFVPAYTGIRLAAERSDTNVDLLFISTLRPRAIVRGKFVAAVVLAVLIFSACTPFMTFSYLLRGVDMPSIVLVIGIDLLTVSATVLLTIFLAVIPANWVLKCLLGLVGLGALLFIGLMTLSGTLTLLVFGVGSAMETREFWATLSCAVASGLAVMGLFYSWSAALINPPSANRALGMRLWLLGVWLVTGLVFGIWNSLLPDSGNGPLITWVAFMGSLCSLALVIAVNERERWAPRMARTIPRRWWLRLPAFLLYSGSAGGVLFALALFGLTWLAVLGWRASTHVEPWSGRAVPTNFLQLILEVMAMIVLYTYDYALAAVLLRRFVVKVKGVYTWVLMVVLVALGSAVPFLVAFLFLFRDWRFERHYAALLTNPFTAAYVASDRHYEHQGEFFLFAGAVAAVLTLLSIPWFARQVRAFQPHVSWRPAPEPPLLEISGSQMDVTKTVG